jgi:hypothetical protein
LNGATQDGEFELKFVSKLLDQLLIGNFYVNTKLLARHQEYGVVFLHPLYDSKEYGLDVAYKARKKKLFYTTAQFKHLLECAVNHTENLLFSDDLHPVVNALTKSNYKSKAPRNTKNNKSKTCTHCMFAGNKEKAKTHIADDCRVKCTECRLYGTLSVFISQCPHGSQELATKKAANDKKSKLGFGKKQEDQKMKTFVRTVIMEEKKVKKKKQKVKSEESSDEDSH